MSNENTPSTLEERVLGPIKEGQVKMTPRWHFVLHTVFLFVGGIFLFLTLFYLISFIIFMLSQTGISSAPQFGLRGWRAFLVSFPWFLIVLSGIFIILLEALVQRAAFAYRRPVLYTTCGVVAVVIVGGFLVAATPLHRDLATYANKGRLPIGGMLYRHFGEASSHEILPGTILQLRKNGFELEDRHTKKFNIVITSRTKLPFGADFEPGDFVFVFGNWNTTTIEAYGIREMRP